MIQIIGKKSPSKRQFIYTLSEILALHYGKYEIYSEHYVEEEEYTEKISVYPLREYCGQDLCMIESQSVALETERIIYYLTPYYKEMKIFEKYLESAQPEEITVIYGEHIKESDLNSKYLSKIIAEKSPKTNYRILKIEWDKIDKLLADEGVYNGFYEISPLSKDYKDALSDIIYAETKMSAKELKSYLKWERGLSK